MFKPLLLFSLCFCHGAHAQLYDDFQDGELASDPTWFGDTASFVVVDQRLRSNSDQVNQHFVIRCPVEDTWHEWQVELELDLSTSSLNYVVLQLEVDPRDTGASLQLVLGGSKDRLECRLLQGQVSQTILTGPDRMTEQSVWSIRCRRWDDSLLVQYRYQQAPYWQTLGKGRAALGACTSFSWHIYQSTERFHRKHFLDRVYVGAIRPDTFPPELIKSTVSSGDSLLLDFNEPLHPGSGDLMLNDQLLTPVSLSPTRFALPLAGITSGTQTVRIMGLEDTAGNTLDSLFTFPFVVFRRPERGDLVFHEIYYDPIPGLDEFVELVNRRSFGLRLDELCLYRIREDGSRDSLLFPDSARIPPGAILLLSRNPQEICARYDCGTGVSMALAIPSLLNDGAILSLRSRDQSIDSMWYGPSLHHPLLEDQKGVSLEKRNPDLPSDRSESWGSASALAGWATPGRTNSLLQAPQSIPDVRLQSRWITPNGDGINDELCLIASNWSPDAVFSAYVFTESGYLVEQLERGLIPGQVHALCWDVRWKGTLAPTGAYILVLTGLDLQGNTFKKKLPFHVDSQY